MGSYSSLSCSEYDRPLRFAMHFLTRRLVPKLQFGNALVRETLFRNRASLTRHRNRVSPAPCISKRSLVTSQKADGNEEKRSSRHPERSGGFAERSRRTSNYFSKSGAG